MKKLLASQLFIGLMVALVLVGGFWVYVKANGGVITVCVSDTGLLRLIENGPGIKPATCVKTLSWNIEGLQGPEGPQGPAGPRPHLTDGNGQDLGILGGANNQSSVQYYQTFFEELGLLIGFNVDTYNRKIDIYPGYDIHYSNDDCTGTPYSVLLKSPQWVFASYDYTRVLKYTGRRLTVRPLSRYDHNGCNNQDGATGEYDELEPVTLPISFPIQWPLRVVPQ